MLSQLVNRIGSSRGCYSGEQVPSLTPDNSERRAAISDIGSNTALTFRFWFPALRTMQIYAIVVMSWDRSQEASLEFPSLFKKKFWGGISPLLKIEIEAP